MKVPWWLLLLGRVAGALLNVVGRWFLRQTERACTIEDRQRDVERLGVFLCEILSRCAPEEAYLWGLVVSNQHVSARYASVPDGEHEAFWKNVQQAYEP